MSENDEVKPFHAKETASGQEAAEAVAAVLKHAKERDEAAKQKAPARKQPRWLLPLGLNLGVFAAYLLIFNPPWVVINPIDPPPTEERVEAAYYAMWTVMGRIEAYRLEQDRLPRTLEEVGVSGEDFDYTVQGTGSYVLLTGVGEETLVYNSAVQTPQEWGAANAAGMAQRIGG
jgi:hypothetical protein